MIWVGVSVRQTRGMAYAWPGNAANPNASTDAPGVTTAVAYGWIVVAAPTLTWALPNGTATPRSARSPARRMIWVFTFARPTRTRARGWSASAATPIASTARPGASTIGASGWIAAAARILNSGAATGTTIGTISPTLSACTAPRMICTVTPALPTRAPGFASSASVARASAFRAAPGAMTGGDSGSIVAAAGNLQSQSDVLAPAAKHLPQSIPLRTRCTGAAARRIRTRGCSG